LSLTRPGNLLRDQIPVRVMFNWDELPFPRVGVDSDNGGEFINHQLKDWRD
jgi:hypothetical protein